MPHLTHFSYYKFYSENGLHHFHAFIEHEFMQKTG